MKPRRSNIYRDIKRILEQAQATAVRAVNFSMVLAYWQIGRRIVEEEQGGKKKAVYGERLLEMLSGKLTADFGKGFSPSNLRYMRQFFLAFPIHHAARDKSSKVMKTAIRHAARDKYQIARYVSPQAALRHELSWTHYRLLIKVENKKARDYYMHEAAEQNWSTRALERQINSFYYERLLSSKKKKTLTAKTKQEAAQDHPSILDFVKDPYVLEFLHLRQDSALFEKELETELLDKLQFFLLELGKGFSFVARQKRISADDEHFYVDLVFYNYILKCFVLIDLKVGKLAHQDIGQMDFYVRYYEDHEKQKSDNPTIGIILCSEKNETVVKYSVLKESKQLFASKYKLYLPTEKELIRELEAELKAIKKRKEQ